jgi:hypothetical protein
MKNLLQFVALLLTLTLAAQPVFADSGCSQRACAHHPNMDCCAHPGTGAMPMNMSCGQSRRGATTPVLCFADACCMISAATIPAIAASNLPIPVAADLTVLPAALWTPLALNAIRRPPRPSLVLPTARYILFRDFRI